MRYQQNYWTLVKEMAISDFKLRFHGSVLGIFWSFLRPLLIFGTLYLVFSVFVRFDTPNYALYLLLGVVMWRYFHDAVNLSIFGMEEKASLIKKIAFPRTILVVSITVTSFISFIFNLVVFAAFFLLSDVVVHWTVLLLPLFVVFLYFLTLGIAYIATALYAKFRDMRQATEVALQLGFWVTPIIYPMSVVPEKYHEHIFLNPFARVIQHSRDAVLYGKIPPISDWLMLFAMTAAVFFIGYYVFKSRAPNFAEEL